VKLAPGATVWAAFSGGLDSTVLLHRLKAQGLPLKALHVNHQLQAAAGRWVEHCRGACAQLGVAFYAFEVKIDPRDPEGPEAAARAARHAAFRSVMKPGDVLATAHHQDDQAETVLLRMMRGTGVAGLAAMRELTPFPPGTMWRPLLRESRASLKAYAERHNLAWVEDPHNLDPRYSRSFLRAEIFPRLTQRWPAAVEQLARTAEHCADAVKLLDELAAREFRACAVPAKAGARHPALSVQKLLKLAPTRRNNVLRYWATAGGFELPGFDALSRLEREVLRARPDREPLLAWGSCELRRFRDSIYLMHRLPPAPEGVALEWNGMAELALPEGCGALKLLAPAKAELPLRVVFARGGERLKPAGARYTRTLRNLFQEEAIPPWVRERIPLVELDGELAAVADRWPAAKLKAALRKAHCRYRWQHELAGCD
jgi:tRNA(Ile)-lysidine synthase